MNLKFRLHNLKRFNENLNLFISRVFEILNNKSLFIRKVNEIVNFAKT